MRQQVSDDNYYKSKDRELVIFLITAKLPIRKLIHKAGRTTFCFSATEAKHYVKLWNSGEPIPISDIRDVYRAESIFNSAIHDELSWL